MFKKTLLGITLFSILTLSALAVPNQLTYSGRLLQNGALVNSTLTMTFKIWSDLTAGALLWSTSNITVPVNQGIYSVVLDQVSPNVFVTDNAYLEVIIDPLGSAETLAPRTRINSVGYALQAGGLSAGGVQAVAVTVSGNVGIGTTSPDSLNDRHPVLEIASRTPDLPGVVLRSGHPSYPENWEMFLNANAGAGSGFNINVGTTNVVHIRRTGNMGISTANPQAKLHVWNSTSNAFLVETRPTAGAAVVPALFANAAGYVGIGTTSPGDKLDVLDQISSMSSFGVAAFLNSYNNYDLSPTISYPVASFVRVGKGGSTWSSQLQIGISRWEASATNARSQADLRLSHGAVSVPDVTVMSLRSDGNVGIGTTAPDNILSVQKLSSFSPGKVDFSVVLNPSSVQRLLFREPASNGTTYFNGELAYVPTTGGDVNKRDFRFAFKNYGTFNDLPDSEVMRIRGDGYVGIGVPNPGAQLEVLGNSTKTAALGVLNIRNTVETPVGISLAAGTTGKLYLNNDSSGSVIIAGGGGNVGIGQAPATEKLAVAGDIKFGSNSGMITTGFAGNSGVVNLASYTIGNAGSSFMVMLNAHGSTNATLSALYYISLNYDGTIAFAPQKIYGNQNYGSSSDFGFDVSGGYLRVTSWPQTSAGWYYSVTTVRNDL
ncbi:MAG: hypothetical protein WC838_01215 [Candidatus Margulisiibacteriota bacterium]|jgi:hypothetical protein